MNCGYGTRITERNETKHENGAAGLEWRDGALASGRKWEGREEKPGDRELGNIWDGLRIYVMFVCFIVYVCAARKLVGDTGLLFWYVCTYIPRFFGSLEFFLY